MSNHEAQSPQHDMGRDKEVVPDADVDAEADYLSISSGSELEPIEVVIAERDWSSASEEEYDEDDIGLKTLALYQAYPSRKNGGGFGEYIPCRICLLERLCCLRLDGPNSPCKLCQGRIDSGFSQVCSTDLRGAKPYRSKYGAHVVLGYESKERPASDPQKVPRSRCKYIEPELPTSNPRHNGSPESDESIIARYFDGNADDPGWKVLQIYLWHRRIQNKYLEHPADRIPCRFCLRKRMSCIRLNGSTKNCIGCVKKICSRDLRGVRGYEYAWGSLLPPELQIRSRSQSTATRTHRLSSNDDGQWTVDLSQNYIEIEESESNEEGKQDLDRIDEDMVMDESMERDDVLSSMFDNNASDPGYQSLLWYWSRKRLDHRSSGVAQRVPCRRCLRAKFEMPEGQRSR